MPSLQSGVATLWFASHVLFGAFVSVARCAEETGAFVRSLAYTSGVAALRIDVEASRVESSGEGDADSPRAVFQGVIPFGRRSSGAMAFMVDAEKNLLFLDRNRNRDMADDGPGIPASTNREGYVRFENLRVEAGSGEVKVPYDIDLWCNDSRYSRYWRLRVKSGWEGIVEIAGRKWGLAVVDDLDGEIGEEDVLILRSVSKEVASAHEAGEMDEDYSERTDRVPLSSNLTINGQSFGLKFAWRGAGASSLLDVTFAPASSDRGTLEIASTRVKRILMEGPAAVVLDPVPESVRLPAGYYSSITAYFAEEGRPAAYLANLRPMRLPADGRRRIDVGGKLNNTVVVSEQGEFLRIAYDLQDANSNACQAVVWRRDAKPSFSIRKDGKQIDSGTFEYG